MDYHAGTRSEASVLRMPMDGFSFRDIKEMWLVFKEETCHVMISLAIDGVNIFGKFRFSYSVWLIFVINNNLPPWISIKREHTMLAMIVLGICLQ